MIIGYGVYAISCKIKSRTKSITLSEVSYKEVGSDLFRLGLHNDHRLPYGR